MSLPKDLLSRPGILAKILRYLDLGSQFKVVSSRFSVNDRAFLHFSVESAVIPW